MRGQRWAGPQRRRSLSAVALVLIVACGATTEPSAGLPSTAPQERAEMVDEIPNVDGPQMMGTPPPSVASLGEQPSGAQAPTKRKLKLVVVGTFDDSLLPPLVDSLMRAWDLDVELLAPIALPQSAYYAPRKRYRADLMAEHVETLLGDNPDNTLVLGLTDSDVSSTKGNVRDWGVIGIAFLGGNSGVLSSHRITRGARDEEHIRRRVEIVAAHEVGHMIGLPHCAEVGCFMRDAEGSLEHVDTATGVLGPQCQAQRDILQHEAAVAHVEQATGGSP